jgi:hypothetical protein
MTGAEVAIVVLNWNGRADTLACLASLARAELGGARVLVVDNGSTDGSVAAIRAGFPAVEVVALAGNRGYAGGNNAGIAAALAAGAAGVLLLNNDTEVAPDFLGPLLDAIDSGPLVAAVSSAVHRHDRPDLLDVAYCDVQLDRRHAVQLVGVNALAGDGFDRRVDVPVVSGCSLLVTARALRAVGLFDEAYFAYHEDVDWCLRAARLGYRFYYEPFSRVYHRQSGSTKRIGPTGPARASGSRPVLPNAEPLPWSPVRTYLGARNLVRLVRTHASRTERRRFAWACLGALPLEFLAVACDREGELVLGRWGWVDARRALLRGTLARDVWRAARTGAFAQVLATVRGLRDGWLDRPLPLERLGLRST